MEVAQPPAAPCPVCESANTRHASVNTAFWHDDRLVVIEDVPALVCGTCGEQFYDDAAVNLIDRVRETGFPPDEAICELRVPVFSCKSVERT